MSYHLLKDKAILATLPTLRIQAPQPTPKQGLPFTLNCCLKVHSRPSEPATGQAASFRPPNQQLPQPGEAAGSHCTRDQPEAGQREQGSLADGRASLGGQVHDNSAVGQAPTIHQGRVSNICCRCFCLQQQLLSMYLSQTWGAFLPLDKALPPLK